MEQRNSPNSFSSSDSFSSFESRGRDGPADFFSDFKGHAVVDAYGVHEGVYLGSDGRILAACCNAHVRRKFVEAKPNVLVAATHPLSIYRVLYYIEDHAAEFSPEDRDLLRQEESVPIMNELHEYLLSKQADFRVLPKSSLGKAVRDAPN